jgi:hypothetical protein
MPRASSGSDVLDIIETLLKAQLKAVDELRSKQDGIEPGDSPDVKPPSSEKRMSQTAMAYEVLVQGGRPLHILEIVRMIQTVFGVALSRDTLVSAVIKKAALGRQFVKTGKNTFGILGRDRS